MNDNKIAVITTEGLLHRRLEQTDLLSMIFFFAFGSLILFVTCSMSQSSRRAEVREQARREEQQREELEHTIKRMQLRRKQLRNAFKKRGLVKILTAANFKLVSGENSDDLEQGQTLPKNIIGDDAKDNSKCRTELPEGQDEIATQSSDNASPRTNRMKSPQDSGTCSLGGATLDSIDKEANEALAVEHGEILFLRNKTPMSIPILCPICLENYQQGETVIVSSNLSCTHGFHQDCILDYLVRHERESYPCPCCRQVFLSTEAMMSDTRKNKASASLELDTGNGTAY